jgi:hypothetical protein
VISPATVSALSRLMSAMATAAPASANRRAMAPPISPPPPAINATRPLSSPAKRYSIRTFLEKS